MKGYLKKAASKLVLILLVLVLVISVPVLGTLAINTQTRDTMLETWAHWLCKIHGAEALFCGDSIMASGGHWSAPGVMSPECFLTRNLAVSGAMTFQVISQVERGVKEYKPHKIYITCGMNDAFAISEGRIKMTQSVNDMKALLAKAVPGEIILTLPTPSRNPEVNAILLNLKQEFREMAQDKATVIDLWPLLCDKEGLLGKDLTVDGVHLSPKGLDIWRSELNKMATEDSHHQGGSAVAK